MQSNNSFDVIIIGGSYSGLAAAMALGRALKRVLVTDAGEPCNRQTPHSHNFLTQDGKTPKEIAALGKEQVSKYETVKFLTGFISDAIKNDKGFEVRTSSGEQFTSRYLVLATGIKDIMPAIRGFAECWGISVLHCPYCHGYEVRDMPTAIIGNGDYGYEFSMLISNWTKEISLLTNGESTLTQEQSARISKHGIRIMETEISELIHQNGQLREVQFSDGSTFPVEVVYSKCDFEHTTGIPESLGCEYTDEGYIKTNAMQKTSVEGVFACGDNSSFIRTVANAVAAGTTAGMMLNKEMVFKEF